jgi:hypothetical protein
MTRKLAASSPPEWPTATQGGSSCIVAVDDPRLTDPGLPLEELTALRRDAVALAL